MGSVQIYKFHSIGYNILMRNKVIGTFIVKNTKILKFPVDDLLEAFIREKSILFKTDQHCRSFGSGPTDIAACSVRINELDELLHRRIWFRISNSDGHLTVLLEQQLALVL